MAQPIRIGLVGLGGICRSRHMPGFARIEGVEVVAVCNHTPGSSRRAAEEFNIPHTEDSWEGLVRRPDVDIVVIGTWPYLHKAISVAALDAGKHVFCQARMAMDLQEARVMLDKANASDRVAGLCPSPFGLNIDKTLDRLRREGWLGDVRLVRVQSFVDAFADADAPMNWRKDHRLSGLNMHTLGIYVEPIHRWFGPTRTVSAQADTFAAERIDPEGEPVSVEIPDQVLLNTRTVQGVPVQYTFSTAVHHGEDRIEIYGSNGSLRYDPLTGKLVGAQREDEWQSIEPRADEIYDMKDWAVEAEFVEAVRGGTPFHPDFDDGYRYMQVVQAAHDSARRNLVVTIEN